MQSTFDRAREAKGVRLGHYPDAIRFVPTDEETYNYALGVVPPAALGRNAFLMGEPYCHNHNGQAMYYGFFYYPQTGYHCALMTLEQFMEAWGT